MKKNISGESFVGIVIGVFILTIVIFGITNLINHSRYTVSEYSTQEALSMLEKSSQQILQAIDTSVLIEGDTFYIYKDALNKNFEILTGALHEEYKYIDVLGDKIDDINTFERDIYVREFTVEKKDLTLGADNYVIDTLIKKYN